MKKLVTVLSVLCIGGLVASPMKNISYGEEVANAKTPVVVGARDHKEKNTNSNKELSKVNYIGNKSNQNSEKMKESVSKLNEAYSNIKDKQENTNSIKEKATSNNKDTVKDNKDVAKDDKAIENNIKDVNSQKDIINPSDEKENTSKDTSKENTDEKVPAVYLSKDQSLNVLKNYLPNVSFYYEGDENTFDYIKNSGLKGYVFLPQVDGDLAYFVDKDSSQIYFFHPSGYLELIG